MLRKNSRLGLGAIPGLLEKGPNRGQYLTTFITWRNVQGPTSLRPTAKSMAPVTSAASTRGPGPAVSGKRARVSRPCGGAGGGMVEPVKEPPLRRAVRVIILEPVRELRCQAKRAELNAVSTGTRNSVEKTRQSSGEGLKRSVPCAWRRAVRERGKARCGRGPQGPSSDLLRSPGRAVRQEATSKRNSGQADRSAGRGRGRSVLKVFLKTVLK